MTHGGREELDQFRLPHRLYQTPAKPVRFDFFRRQRLFQRREQDQRSDARFAWPRICVASSSPSASGAVGRGSPVGTAVHRRMRCEAGSLRRQHCRRFARPCQAGSTARGRYRGWWHCHPLPASARRAAPPAPRGERRLAALEQRTVNQNVEPSPARYPHRSARPSTPIIAWKWPSPSRCHHICGWSRHPPVRKLWNSRCNRSAGMPIPVSDTLNRMTHCIVRFLFHRDPHRHFPGLGEFDGVVDEIDQHLPEPVGIAAHLCSDLRIDGAGQFQSLSCGAWARISTASSTTIGRSNSICSSSSFPASILEKSRIWLITASNTSADDLVELGVSSLLG